MFYLTSKFHVSRINTFGFREGGGAFEALPPGPGTPEKPRPNRVKTGLEMRHFDRMLLL